MRIKLNRIESCCWVWTCWYLGMQCNFKLQLFSMVNSAFSNAVSHLMFLQVSTDGGTVRTADSQYFPASTAMSGSLVHFKPGALRQMHWHVNEDEWQFVINGTVEVIRDCALKFVAASVHAGILQVAHGDSCVAHAACHVVSWYVLNLLFLFYACSCCTTKWKRHNSECTFMCPSQQQRVSSSASYQPWCSR